MACGRATDDPPGYPCWSAKMCAGMTRPLAPSDTRTVGFRRNPARPHTASGCASRQTSHSASSSGSRATSDQPHSSQRDRFSRSIRQNAHGISGVTRPGKATSTRTRGRSTRLGEVFRSTPWRCQCPSTPTDDRQPSVYVFVSLPDNIQETFGLVVIEAMASGLPVVGSDWDGYRDLILDGETGCLVPTRMVRGATVQATTRLHCENSDRQRRGEYVQASGHLGR